jgi:hypothetical protein
MKEVAVVPVPEDIDPRIASRVRALRADLGMTLDALASKSGVSRWLDRSTGRESRVFLFLRGGQDPVRWHGWTSRFAGFGRASLCSVVLPLQENLDGIFASPLRRASIGSCTDC